jgi:hypothetical protein
VLIFKIKSYIYIADGGYQFINVNNISRNRMLFKDLRAQVITTKKFQVSESNNALYETEKLDRLSLTSRDFPLSFHSKVEILS